MEKKLTIKDIVAFIQTAVYRNCKILVDVYNYSEFSIYSVLIKYGENKIYFRLNQNEITIEKEITIDNDTSNKICIKEFSELEKTNLILEILKAKEYSENKTYEYFTNFFNEDNTRPTDINDLDDKDD